MIEIDTDIDKSLSPADTLPVKIRSARQSPGRDEFNNILVNCRPGEICLGAIL